MAGMPTRLGALVVVLALVAAGCGGGEDAYSPEVERNFTDECVDSAVGNEQSGLSEAEATEYCSCTYDEISAEVPFAEFAEYDEQAREDEATPLPPKFEDAAIRCRIEQGYTEGVGRTFTSECVKSAVEDGVGEAQAREFCGCAFSEIKAKVPFEEFAEYDAKARKDPSAKPPPAMNAAIERCAESLG